MKRIDFYLEINLILFVLCISLSNREFTDIRGYFYFLENDTCMLYKFSLINLIAIILLLFTIIFREIKKYRRKQ